MFLCQVARTHTLLNWGDGASSPSALCLTSCIVFDLRCWCPAAVVGEVGYVMKFLLDLNHKWTAAWIEFACIASPLEVTEPCVRHSLASVGACALN